MKPASISSNPLAEQDAALAEHRPLLSALEELAHLKYDWNGYGAEPVDPVIIEAARQFVCALPQPLPDLPRVVPMTRGRLQFEWHHRTRSLELEFETPDRMHYLQCDDAQALEEEDTLPADGRTGVLALLESFFVGESNG